MSLHDEISKAIGAHGMWKTRLNTAIATGKSEFMPEKVCVDNQCDFGKWLYGASLTGADKHDPHYEKVRTLHAEFHKLAANVLTLALEGKKEEAKKLVEPSGRFAGLSAELTMAMMDWAKKTK